MAGATHAAGIAAARDARMLHGAFRKGSVHPTAGVLRVSTRRSHASPDRGNPRRRSLRVEAVGWDPEGILSAPQPGHIARRQMQKSLKEADQEAQKVQEEQRREQIRRQQAREARIVPEDPSEFVEFFLRIEAEEGPEELEFEVARCGPRLTESFFSTLRSAMGTIRFAAQQSEADLQRLARLEKLEKQLLSQVERQEALRSSITAAGERLQALLSAKDKKEKILAMAAAGELDLGLLALLDENIAAAQQAQQEKAVEFMEKVRGAVVKYMSKEQLAAP